MASVRPYRYQGRKNHWECAVSLGPDPDRPGRYLKKSFVLCPASCDLGCSPYPDYRARTSREAERAADAIRDRLKAGADLQRRLASTPSFADLVDQWLTWLATTDKTRNTLHSYEGLARRHLVPVFGARPAADITPQDLQNHIDSLRASGLSPATCQRVLSVARQVYKWATKRVEGITVNPAREVDRPTQSKQSVKMPSAQAVQLVLGAIDRQGSRWLAVFALLAASTGARRGELCALRWADVDLEQRTVSISRSVNRWREIGSTKTHAARTVPLGDTALAALHGWKAETLNEVRQAEGDIRTLPGEWLVFPSDDGPTMPRNPDAVTRALSRALARFRAEHPEIELADRVWMHGLRHYAASNLMRGGDAVETARLLGHSTPAVTLNVYGHPLDDGRDAIDRLDRSLRPATPPESGINKKDG